MGRGPSWRSKHSSTLKTLTSHRLFSPDQFRTRAPAVKEFWNQFQAPKALFPISTGSCGAPLWTELTLPDTPPYPTQRVREGPLRSLEDQTVASFLLVNIIKVTLIVFVDPHARAWSR